MDVARQEAISQAPLGNAEGSHLPWWIPLILVWAIWVVATAALFLYIRHYTRNIPYMDDWSMVPVVTGHEPMSLRWAWSQHNEHRAFVPRLILASLFRLVAPDFRTGLYFNAGLLSLAAAMMLVLARRVRGQTRLTDAVLPLSILTLAQAEVLLIGFALNLVLTAWISYALIAILAGMSQRPPWMSIIPISVFLVLLPLCGGSGLVMLPPLMLWLAGYLGWGWWSGRETAGWVRAAGLLSLLACAAIVALYLRDYVRPAHHPSAPSLGAIMQTTLEVLSLSLTTSAGSFWNAAGLAVLALVVGTLTRFVFIALRFPLQRPRALGLAAVIVALIGVALSVGVSRSGFGPGAGLQSRYVCLASPLPCGLYIGWLLYCPRREKWAFQSCLLLIICLSLPGSWCSAKARGGPCLDRFKQIERALLARRTTSEVLELVSPSLYPDRTVAADMLQMLGSSKLGRFRLLDDHRIAVAPNAATSSR